MMLLVKKGSSGIPVWLSYYASLGVVSWDFFFPTESMGHNSPSMRPLGVLF